MNREMFTLQLLLSIFYYFIVICKICQIHTGISVTNQYSVDKATMVNIKATNVVTKADRARTTFSLAICVMVLGGHFIHMAYWKEITQKCKLNYHQMRRVSAYLHLKKKSFKLFVTN